MNFDNDPIVTPKEARLSLWHWLPTFILYLAAVLVFIGIVIWAGSQFGWWLNNQAAQHQTHTITNGIGYQTGQITDLNQQIGNVTDLTTSMIGTSGITYAGFHAQRLGDAKLACADAIQIITIPAGDQGWVSQNCASGTVSSTSPLRK
jgi:hypothetical protein